MEDGKNEVRPYDDDRSTKCALILMKHKVRPLSDEAQSAPLW